MQKQKRFVGLLTAIIVGFLVAVGVQAFTQTKQPSSSQGAGEQSSNATIEVKQVTFVPAPDMPTATALPVLVASPLPTVPPVTYDTAPTAEPIDPAPAVVSLASDETELLFDDFSTTDLTDWQYGQIFWDPLPAPAWSVQENEYIQAALVSPENRDTITTMNDTMAFPPISLDGDGGIEASAISNSAEKVGLVLGNVEKHDYLIAVFSTTNASGMGKAGFTLVRITGETRATLYHEAAPVIERDTWYRLRMEVENDAIVVSLDGKEVVSLPVMDDLTITDGGLLAGSDGYAYFDNVRVFGK